MVVGLVLGGAGVVLIGPGRHHVRLGRCAVVAGAVLMYVGGAITAGWSL